MSKEQYEFQWTTELVKEFFNKYGNSYLYLSPSFPKIVEEFIQSKQPKKEWEIVSFKNDLHKGIFPRLTNGYFMEKTDEFTMIKYYSIHSVKRLSDGEVFTVGDEVEYKSGGQLPFINTISDFRIQKSYDPYLRIGFPPNSQYGCSLEIVSHTKKPKKKSLFTTEDGVKVFPCDDFHVAVLDTGSIESMRANESDRGMWLGAKLFSTKEKAEEYILLNRPCLSVNDVAKIICDNNRCGVDYSISRDLKQLAKEKIKQ